MAKLFKRLSVSFKSPTLSKNNNINAFADVIANKLDNSYFICLKRDTPYLAQSLLKARLEINGNIAQSYGVANVESMNSDSDPVAQVIQQITYLDNMALAQQERIGLDRFWIVSYEEFCANPENLVNRIKTEVLGQPESQLVTALDLPIIENNNHVTDPQLFERLKNATVRISPTT